MMLVVSGVGTLIHIYAIGYMHEDVRFKNDEGRFTRFFVFLNLFIAMMMILVSRRLVPDALRRLGRRGLVLLPADRLLVRDGYAGTSLLGEFERREESHLSSTASATLAF